MKKKIFIALLLIIFCLPIVLGCSNNSSKGIKDISKVSTDGLVDTYQITYTDGSSKTFTITNGSQGEAGEDFDVETLFNKYLDAHPDITYEEFLEKFLSVDPEESVVAVNKNLQSVLQIYCEFIEQTMSFAHQIRTGVSMAQGSAVIYKIEEEYTYIITNYHVVYDANSITEGCLPRNIYCYLYGSESSPTLSGETDSNDLPIYDYGNYGIKCSYVGGSITADLAIVKAKTSEIKAINENIKAIEFADNYHVGEVAYAIGNPEGEGISVTEGVVSVDNEFISLAIDKSTRNYRSIRIDTSIYSGSSGGGLFNSKGDLIGITNAGSNSDENINYAIPVDIVKRVVENIMYYNSNVYKITLGITVTSANSKYVYDSKTGYGNIVEDILIDSVKDSSIAVAMGLKSKDIIKGIYVDSTYYALNRYFSIGDILYTIRANSSIKFKLDRDNTLIESASYTVLSSDLSQVE